MISRETCYLHLEASLALHIHEERVGSLHQALELVLALLKLLGGIQQINIAVQDHLSKRKEGERGGVNVLKFVASVKFGPTPEVRLLFSDFGNLLKSCATAYTSPFSRFQI